VLLGDRPLGLRIIVPGPAQCIERSMSHRVITEANGPGKCFHRRLIQTDPFAPGSLAEGSVYGRWNST
jgi:hypothetical protein